MSRAAIPTALRRLVYERAHGRCEYCLLPEIVVLVPHEVDHIIAEKHAGSTQADNLALACSLCNRHKGTDIAPRRNPWADHFALQGALFVARTAIGRVTLRLRQLNLPGRVLEREILLASGSLNLPES